MPEVPQFLQYSLEVIGGILLLFLGGDQFVKGSVTLATLCRIPQLVIGLTVVSSGTSAPELFVSVSSILQGADDRPSATWLAAIFSTFLWCWAVQRWSCHFVSRTAWCAEMFQCCWLFLQQPGEWPLPDG